MSVIQTFSNSLADISFWIGLLAVVLFAKNRFAISLPEPDNLSPPISARSFTTAFRYQIAAFAYVGLFVAAYFTLIMVGCVPWLQDLLKQWIGTLDTGNEKIGTPAWAALAATTLLPSAPGFKRVDEKIRQTFHDFASIPAKAKLIGREIMMAIKTSGPFEANKETSIEDVMKVIQYRRDQFSVLQQLCEKLKDIEVPPRVARAYESFFKVAQKVIDTISEDFKLELGKEHSDEAVRQLEAKLTFGTQRMAKLLACAMLQSEPSEAAIQDRLGHSGIHVRPVSFNFTAQHLIMMFVIIAGMTLVGCYLGLIAYALAQEDFAGTLQTYKLIFLTWPKVIWPLTTVCVYLLPIVLSAGMVMYKLDEKSWKHAPDFTTGFTSGVMVFLGSAGLAFLAILAYSVLMVATGNRNITDFRILPLIPWSLPAATVATLFLFMSTRTWCLSRWSGMAVDAIVHGVGAAAASACALFLATLAGAVFTMPAGMMPYLAPISAGTIGASIGAVLCASTRRKVCAVGHAHCAEAEMPVSGLAAAAGMA